MESALARLGIVGNLYKVYRAAIELGDVPVSKIIERTGLPKATVYGALDRLEHEGLVAESNGEGLRRVRANEPGVLLEHVEARKQMLTEVLPQLRAHYYRAQGKPNIRFYEGEEGVRTAYWESISGDAGELRAVFSMAELMEVPGLPVVDEYMAERVRRGKFMRVVRSRSHDRAHIWQSSHAELRELRYAPAAIELSMTFVIYGSRVALMSSAKECYGLIIESEEYAQMMRAMYESLWLQSEPTPYID
ncbi:MarR family winged helix-turn-helix transcriptional regulator [Xylophilus sp. GOD-11R]|uniref:TrmB family transcriptional regulator n=1 Tax=Xylophilus sp. GOD-11R TaxID=3089814 RepID=UPI00298CA9FF|nr:MarR family winged helix-turn-helix transcriptional regulator [Xylophilus sp. GOD-11R]WPB55571.1 MarR family winged helix-turn-helix transcriptional regulator [Xylophilus sp. GOD-11R]